MAAKGHSLQSRRVSVSISDLKTPPQRSELVRSRRGSRLNEEHQDGYSSGDWSGDEFDDPDHHQIVIPHQSSHPNLPPPPFVSPTFSETGCSASSSFHSTSRVPQEKPTRHMLDKRTALPSSANPRHPRKAKRPSLLVRTIGSVTKSLKLRRTKQNTENQADPPSPGTSGSSMMYPKQNGEVHAAQTLWRSSSGTSMILERSVCEASRSDAAHVVLRRRQGSEGSTQPVIETIVPPPMPPSLQSLPPTMATGRTVAAKQRGFNPSYHPKIVLRPQCSSSSSPPPSIKAPPGLHHERMKQIGTFPPPPPGLGLRNNSFIDHPERQRGASASSAGSSSGFGLPPPPPLGIPPPPSVPPPPLSQKSLNLKSSGEKHPVVLVEPLPGPPGIKAWGSVASSTDLPPLPPGPPPLLPLNSEYAPTPPKPLPPPTEPPPGRSLSTPRTAGVHNGMQLTMWREEDSTRSRGSAHDTVSHPLGINTDPKNRAIRSAVPLPKSPPPPLESSEPFEPPPPPPSPRDPQGPPLPSFGPDVVTRLSRTSSSAPPSPGKLRGGSTRPFASSPCGNMSTSHRSSSSGTTPLPLGPPPLIAKSCVSPKSESRKTSVSYNESELPPLPPGPPPPLASHKPSQGLTESSLSEPSSHDQISVEHSMESASDQDIHSLLPSLKAKDGTSAAKIYQPHPPPGPPPPLEDLKEELHAVNFTPCPPPGPPPSLEGSDEEWNQACISPHPPSESPPPLEDVVEEDATHVSSLATSPEMKAPSLSRNDRTRLVAPDMDAATSLEKVPSTITLNKFNRRRASSVPTGPLLYNKRSSGAHGVDRLILLDTVIGGEAAQAVAHPASRRFETEQQITERNIMLELLRKEREEERELRARNLAQVREMLQQSASTKKLKKEAEDEHFNSIAKLSADVERERLAHRLEIAELRRDLLKVETALAASTATISGVTATTMAATEHEETTSASLCKHKLSSPPPGVAIPPSLLQPADATTYSTSLPSTSGMKASPAAANMDTSVATIPTSVYPEAKQFNPRPPLCDPPPLDQYHLAPPPPSFPPPHSGSGESKKQDIAIIFCDDLAEFPPPNYPPPDLQSIHLSRAPSQPPDPAAARDSATTKDEDKYLIAASKTAMPPGLPSNHLSQAPTLTTNSVTALNSATEEQKDATVSKMVIMRSPKPRTPAPTSRPTAQSSTNDALMPEAVSYREKCLINVVKPSTNVETAPRDNNRSGSIRHIHIDRKGWVTANGRERNIETHELTSTDLTTQPPRLQQPMFSSLLTPRSIAAPSSGGEESADSTLHSSLRESLESKKSIALEDRVGAILLRRRQRLQSSQEVPTTANPTHKIAIHSPRYVDVDDQASTKGCKRSRLGRLGWSEEASIVASESMQTFEGSLRRRLTKNDLKSSPAPAPSFLSISNGRPQRVHIDRHGKISIEARSPRVKLLPPTVLDSPLLAESDARSPSALFRRQRARAAIGKEKERHCAAGRQVETASVRADMVWNRLQSSVERRANTPRTNGESIRPKGGGLSLGGLIPVFGDPALSSTLAASHGASRQLLSSIVSGEVLVVSSHPTTATVSSSKGDECRCWIENDLQTLSWTPLHGNGEKQERNSIPITSIVAVRCCESIGSASCFELDCIIPNIGTQAGTNGGVINMSYQFTTGNIVQQERWMMGLTLLSNLASAARAQSW